MQKKGIESVEVWMWIVAGLIIGSLVFVAGYTMLSHWVHSNEVSAAQKSFSQLKASVLNVCAIGTDRQEVESYIFPTLVSNLTVFNKSNRIYGEGFSLCINIKDEGLYCEEMNKAPNSCMVEMYMKNMTFERKDSVFAVFQKALGEAKASKVEFTITKKSRDKITIDWKEVFLD